MSNLTKNASSADNQQERPQEEWLNKIPNELGFYLVGFVDGEGSFNVSGDPCTIRYVVSLGPKIW